MEVNEKCRPLAYFQEYLQNGYYPFYMEYDWYRNMEHHVVSDSELNEYEQANRDLIVAIERKEGYRK